MITSNPTPGNPKLYCCVWCSLMIAFSLVLSLSAPVCRGRRTEERDITRAIAQTPTILSRRMANMDDIHFCDRGVVSEYPKEPSNYKCLIISLSSLFILVNIRLLNFVDFHSGQLEQNEIFDSQRVDAKSEYSLESEQFLLLLVTTRYLDLAVLRLILLNCQLE